MCFKGLRTVPLWADPAPGCGVTAASSSCTGDTAPHNTASASAADPPLPQPAAAAGTPSDAPTTPASPALALTDSRSVPWGITAVFSLARSIILTRQNELIAGGVMKKKTHIRWNLMWQNSEAPLWAALCAGDTVVSGNPAGRSAPSFAASECAAGTSSPPTRLPFPGG